MNLTAILLAAFLTIVMVAQIALAFVLYDPAGNTALRTLGWGIWWLSALFGWLPMFTFKKWGGVAKGKSYVHTTVLVDRGLYAIVRHPQYVAGMLMGIALTLITQHWSVAILGAVAIVILYINTYDEETAARKKFGADYEGYARRVPRVNFAAGGIRWLRRWWRRRQP
jgi:protein-S-isoprenylcysteine O-methyltransferase Ste14